mmetsp:Transcript_12207/g.24915  ORF Transcript_12207/g.24915 Transcript_12207/m.24915 type:complete len:88 (-) Transcript_12207:827-1090(-)
MSSYLRSEVAGKKMGEMGNIRLHCNSRLLDRGGEYGSSSILEGPPNESACSLSGSTTGAAAGLSKPSGRKHRSLLPIHARRFIHPGA